MSGEDEYELIQVFRAIYKDKTSRAYTPSTETIKIKPWSVSKSGEHIILWSDIMAAFGNPVNAMNIVVDGPRIEVAMGSLQIQGSPASSSISSASPRSRSSSEMPAAPNISSPSTIAENVGQPQQPGRTWQDNCESRKNIMLSKPESNDQSPQLVPDYKDNDHCNCDGTGFTIDSQQHNEVFVYRGDEREADEDYVQGLAYHEGKNVRQDYIEALDLFLRAANRGHALAQFKLRNIIENREAVEHDYSKAYERYLEAAKQGCADAQSNLGFLYQVGYGVTKDYYKAAEWYQKATEQGHTYAHCNLGIMYNRGLGVTQDHFKALELCRISADAGYARAQNSLGFMYGDGSGVTQDYSKAVEMYRKAADQGYAVA
ncbi:hypothetical protein BGX21_005964, partial [Mortierella sp. AD011]